MALTTGFTPQTAADNLIKVQDALRRSLGADVDLTQSSLTGLFVQEWANSLSEVEDSKTLLYTGIYNPNIAYGIFLDSIAKFDNVTRRKAFNSTALVTITGTPGTVIPIGAQVKNANGNIFATSVATTIPVGGTISDVTVTAVDPGLILVGANTINLIITSVIGWDSVNNPLIGSVGQLVETDADFRSVRKYKTAINSSGSIPALRAAFLAQAFILDSAVVSNDSAIANPIGGVTIQPYSLYISLNYPRNSANDTTIAQIVYNKKAPGAPMQGNVPLIYADPDRTYNHLTVYINIPTFVPVYIIVEILNDSTYITGDVTTQIKEAIVKNFSGSSTLVPTDLKVTIGASIYTSRFYREIAALGIYQTRSIKIGFTASPTTDYVDSQINQLATLDPNNIVVTFV